MNLFVDWCYEIDYLRDCAMVRGELKEFNFDTECFIRYATMQMHSAPKEFADKIRAIINGVTHDPDSGRAWA